MIIYLHGFRSSPGSRKATQLRDRMTMLGRGADYQCPALPVAPRRAVDEVLRLVQERDDVALIGSSLGGFYATWIAEKVGCRAVLLNPAIAPYRDLRAYVGEQAVYFSDGATIDFREEYLEELRELDPARITQPERYFLIAATGDALIDYRSMLERYPGARRRVIEGSNHELSDFTDYMDEVLEFCGVDVETDRKGMTS